MLWLWLVMIGVMQSSGTIFCKVLRLVTAESVSLDSQCDSALSHRSPSYFLFLSSRALESFCSHYSLVAHSPLLGASHGNKERWHNQNREQHCCLGLKWLVRQQMRRLKVWKKKKTLVTVLPLSLAKSMYYLSFSFSSFRAQFFVHWSIIQEAQLGGSD